MPTSQGQTYLNAAREALTHVRTHVPYGAANSVRQFATTDPAKLVRQLRAMDRLLATRRAIDRSESEKFVDYKDNLRKVGIWAADVIKNGGGNCGEQSALAFEYLRTKGIQPLDWCGFTTRDHAFVIIGRPSGDATVNVPPASWVEDAVICDPWQGTAGYWAQMFAGYPPSEIGSNLYYSRAALPVWVNK